jgi:PcRGLX-like protein central beta sandwich domain
VPGLADKEKIDMRIHNLVLLATLLSVSTLVAAGELSVNLNLTERAGTARKAEPVQGGVPLPPGTIKDVSELSVLGPDGKAVPAQFKVLNRHWAGDKSPKWVLCLFMADVAAGGKAVYKLVKGANPAPARALKLINTAAGVSVDTGALAVVIDATSASIFRSVKLGGREMIKPGVEAGFVVEGMDGKRYSSTKDLIGKLKVTVLESGPVRANILVEGALKAGENGAGYEVADGRGGRTKVAGRNGEKLGFTLRYEFYAGKAFCRVFHTVRCLGAPYRGGEDKKFKGWPYYVMRAGKTGNFFTKSAEMVVPLDLGGASSYVLGGDRAHAGKLSAGENAYLYQGSSAGWTWQVAEKKIFDPGLKKNAAFMKGKGKKKPYYEYLPGFYDILKKREGCPFMGYRQFTGKRGAESETLKGNRALGWVHLAGAGGAVTSGVRYFWEKYPKSLEVGADGKLIVGLWPKRWKRGHFFEGRVHRTHETFWQFHAAAAPDEAAKTATAFNAPLYVMCDPEWYINKTGTFALAAVAGKAKLGNYEDWARTAVYEDQLKGKINHSWDSSIPVEREKYDEYGVWHFGDGSKGGGMWYFSQFGEFDVTYTLLLHGARHGDPEFMERAEENARHIMGVPAHEGGYGHQWAESSHNWTRGLGIYYLMTGQYEAWEALHNWLTEFHVKTSQGEFHNKNNAWQFNGRNGAWAVRGLWNMYDLFGEQRFLDEFKRGLGVIHKRQNKSSGQFGGGGPMSFQMGTFVAAVGEHYARTGDEEWLDVLLGGVEYFRAKNGRGDWVSPGVMDGYAYAYIWTGYDKYKALMDKGGRYYEKSKFAGSSKNPARYRMGTAAPKSWTTVMRYMQPYLWTKANPRKDRAAPAAIADLAATAAGGGKVKLSWTAPGDNDSTGGKAARYHLKYSRKAFDEEGGLKWWAVTNAKGEPAPATPGSKQSMELSLGAGTWYLAIKTRDASNNLSPISKVIKVEVK